MLEALSKPKHLLIHEWVLAWTLLAIISALSLFFFLNRESTFSEELVPPHYIVDNEIEVFIEGAVKKPGKYRIKRGSSVKELITLAIAREDADLSKVKERPLKRKNQKVKIPVRKKKKK